MFIIGVNQEISETEPLNHEQPTFIVVVKQLIRELMKEILQTNNLKLNHLLIVHLLMHSCILSYRERARDQQAIEAVQVEETEEVYPEQQPQEFEVADQVEEQALDSNFANPDLQQGKNQISSTQCLTFFKFMQLLILMHLSY